MLPDDEHVRWFVVIIVAACTRTPEILYPPVTGHQATPFSDPPSSESCRLVHLTEYIETSGPGATLRGTVVDAANRPAVGATVVATGHALVGEQVVITDEAGSYNIGALPPGDYILTIYYDDRIAHHPLEVRRGVESIDHTRTIDEGCPRPSPCANNRCDVVSQVQRDARTR